MRTGDDQGGGIFRELDFSLRHRLKGMEFGHLVVRLLEFRLDDRHSGLGVIDVFFPVPLDEIDLLRPLFDDLDDGVYQFLLGGESDSLDFVPGVEHDGSEGDVGLGRRPVFGGLGGLGLLIDHLHRDVIAVVAKLGQQVEGPLRTVFAVEDDDFEVAVEVREDRDRLIGERVLLGTREVPTLVVAIRQIVDASHDPCHQQDHESQVDAVTGPSFLCEDEHVPPTGSEVEDGQH